MTIAVKEFGTFKGKRVDQFTLTSASGVEVDIINWGVVVRDWRVPVTGGQRSVVLGFDEFAPYPAHSPYFGALVGRVANRIAGASFTLDGVHYPLDANEAGNTLHGGVEGLARQVWAGAPDSAGNCVRFTHTSPDGTMGFPGTVAFSATYTLTGNRLRLELSASTDRRTPISLVQHQYFNLGTGDDVLDHHVRINASARAQAGADLLPSGAIVPVTGSPYDFRDGRTQRDGAGQPIDYDTCLVLATGRNPAEPIASVRGPDGALTLKLWSTQPAVQFYNAPWTNVAVPGLGGKRYGKHSGLCLEDQMYPDAVHHAHFPSIIVGPEAPYSHWCEFEIG